jgi:hypothetical protein
MDKFEKYKSENEAMMQQNYELKEALKHKMRQYMNISKKCNLYKNKVIATEYWDCDDEQIFEKSTWDSARPAWNGSPKCTQSKLLCENSVGKVHLSQDIEKGIMMIRKGNINRLNKSQRQEDIKDAICKPETVGFNQDNKKSSWM